MITRVGARNYKNLDLGEEGLTLGPLAVFVGANGSGKSNLIQLLRFFQEAMTGAPEARRGVTAFQAAVQKLGDGRILNSALPYPSRIDLSLEFEDTRPNHDSPHQLQLGLLANRIDTVTVAEESLSTHSLASQPFFYYTAHGDEIGSGKLSMYDDTGHAPTADQEIDSLPNNQLAFQSLQSVIETAYPLLRDTPYYLMRRRVHTFVADWAIYSASAMDLEEVRQAEPTLGPGDTALSESGENLALVLHNLGRNLDFEERLTEAMRELFPRTRKLRVATVGLRSLTLEWFVHGSERPFYLDEMSDGTVRMLCWAAVLLSPKPSTLIVLDEPEAGVHPAWLRVLAGWIREASRKTQVIVSTHSSDLLDYFTEDLESVHVFQSAADPALMTVKTLRREPLAEKLDEGWKLGDLYRVGAPEIGGWPW